jgi:uncharacterized protein with GYD domain
MPRYMTQFAYTPEAWSALARQPEDRSKAIAQLCEKLGGRLIDLYYAFGDYDGFLIFEAPDDVTAAGVVLAAVSPGHVKAVKTVPLLTVEQTLEALRKAGSVTYRAPGEGSD